MKIFYNQYWLSNAVNMVMKTSMSDLELHIKILAFSKKVKLCL